MGTAEGIQDFVYKYYIDPIISDAGYNPVNTITWAILLGLCLFGVLKLLEKMDVRADWEFTKVIIPYIIAGSTLRVIEDAELFEPPIKYLFITPPIYLLMFAITVLLLFISIRLQRSGYVNDWKKAFAAAGILWSLVNIGILLLTERITNPVHFAAIILLGTGLTAVAYLLTRNRGCSMFRQHINISILYAHLLDASSTFVGVDYMGYYEKHVVPTFLINLTGTAAIMIPLKLIIFIPVIFMLDTQFDENDDSRRLRDLMKLTIIVLGLAPATRNTLRMVFGI
ncbi:MAG: DUF63 family protein [Methanosarcinales archaeon]|nr:DUF63 family protein [Methanosarcinales archaeon]